MFVSDVVQALLIEWALARGEPAALVARARDVMLEPHPGGVHDDHFHIRTTCSVEETATGCRPVGPRRRWMREDAAPLAESDEDLAIDLFTPLAPPAAGAER
jgi:hypothetical protein